MRKNSRWVGDQIKCNRCDTVRPVSDYYRNSSRADGYSGFCKPCDNSYAPRKKTGSGQKKSKRVQIRKPKLTKLTHREKRYEYYQKRAEIKSIVFSLAREEVVKLVSSPCTYCGGYSNGAKVNGIDRHNNNLGYTTDNSVSCCSVCNKMKFTWESNFFLSHVKKIAMFND